jgi:hypothetical protein
MTADIPKSLLPMGEKTVLDWTLDAITKKQMVKLSLLLTITVQQLKSTSLNVIRNV